MRPHNLIVSPRTFLVEPYAPGQTIDFRSPTPRSVPEAHSRLFVLPDTAGEDLGQRLGRALVDLGITESASDASESLAAFTAERHIEEQIEASLRRLGVDPLPSSRDEQVELLLRKTGCLERCVHHALRLYCHAPGTATVLEGDATHYGYVLTGECAVRERKRTVAVGANTFFCLAGEGVVEGPGQCVVITRFGFLGLTLYGGEIEAWGRLKYIDGCTDTLLVAPPRRGDPCLNSLYFPPSTRQTRHVHPSARCGVILSGEGICETPSGDLPLAAGDIFFLPPETPHAFRTSDAPVADRAALSVLAFHPDSDFGPTDDEHPMINRTYFRFLHRLRSAIASSALR